MKVRKFVDLRASPGRNFDVIPGSNFTNEDGVVMTAVEVTCGECSLVWTCDESEGSLLADGYQLEACLHCGGKGEVMETCTTNYHLSPANRSSATCRIYSSI